MTNDRFKYRIYDVANKKYVENPEDFEPWNLPDGFIAEQCTGVKDKKGRLIFEGDVFKEDGDTYVIVWDETWAMFMQEDTSGNRFYLNGFSERYEIVGNVHKRGEK